MGEERQDALAIVLDGNVVWRTRRGESSVSRREFDPADMREEKEDPEDVVSLRRVVVA